MSDEHQVSSVDNFLSIPEEDGGNGQVYLSQPAPGIQGSSDGQQWESGVSNGRVVVGTENPLPSNPALHQQGSTPVVPSSVSTSTAGGRTAFPERVPLPGDHGRPGLRPPRLAYPAPQQELPSSPTPHSPVAEEFWAEQGFPGSIPVEESSGTINDVTEAEIGSAVNYNVINDRNDRPEDNPPVNDEEGFISVQHKKLLDENRQLKDWKTCLVCLNRAREVMILPCGHVCVCSICVAGLERKCPVCRGYIEETVRIRLAPFLDAGGRRPNESVVS